MEAEDEASPVIHPYEPLYKSVTDKIYKGKTDELDDLIKTELDNGAHNKLEALAL